MRIAALDLGSNTFLCLIADVHEGRGVDFRNTICDEARVVRLAEGVDATGRICDAALARADICFAEYALLIADAKPDRIVACATSAARDAKNGDEFVALGRQHGIPIRIIDGEREADLTFWGVVGALCDSEVAIIDVGGGSTEIIVGDSSGPTFKTSAQVGSVRLTERHLPRHPSTAEDLNAARAFASSRFSAAAPPPRARESVRPRKVIAVAGTATTLAALDIGKPFDAREVEGHVMTLDRIREWTHRLSELSVAEREALLGMDAKRADVILAGALCLELACETLETQSVEVCTRGLRYGIAARWKEFK